MFLLPVSVPLDLCISLFPSACLCFCLSLFLCIPVLSPLNRGAVVDLKPYKYLTTHPDTEQKGTGLHLLHTSPLPNVQEEQIEAQN